MRIRISTLVLAAAAASQMGNTDCGQALRDSGFDLWCGDQLCAWKLERGAVKQIPTWNQGDYGVELDGSDVAIEQLSPVDSGDGTCIEFTLVANVDASADVELNVDVLGDGTIDHHERLPAANWKPLKYDLLIKPPYRGIRFELAKTGDGKAQLANIGAETIHTDGACAGLTAIDPGPAPLGAYCDVQATDSTCASGLCQLVNDPDSAFGIDAACGQCDDTHPCDASQICGLHEPTSPVREASAGCVAQAAKQLGERCTTAGECASNICSENGRCSACTPGDGCTFCGPAWQNGPYICHPGEHLGAPGAACATDDDCASEACLGPVRDECSDGRPCGTPIDCPFGTGSAAPLQNGACTTVGVQGGTCQ